MIPIQYKYFLLLDYVHMHGNVFRAFSFVFSRQTHANTISLRQKLYSLFNCIGDIFLWIVCTGRQNDLRDKNVFENAGK